jgi:hypothetical protein
MECGSKEQERLKRFGLQRMCVYAPEGTGMPDQV